MVTIVPVTPAPIPRSLATIDYDDQWGNSYNIEPSTIDDDSNAAVTVLLHTFLIRKKRFRVFYNAGMLVWERYKSKKGRITVPIANILAINPQILNKDDLSHEQHNEQSNTNEHRDQAIPPPSSTLPPTPNIKQFTIVYAKRMESSSNLNKWRHFTVIFYNNDSHVCQLWIRTLQKAINEQITRPKRLLLFVNPYGGKKRALQIYDGNVKPIFQIAGIDASVVISQRSNQIRDFIMTQSLEHFDGIVCIGGDGTFSEVFNGLIFRTIKDLGLNDLSVLDALPKIKKPIGIIPAGSTDTVAYCLNGTCDIRTTVLNIVLGQVDGLDLSSVSNQHRLLKFYASVMSYGFLGDVAIESEKFRWMGPKRYDYSGFKKLLLNRGYNGEISMILAPLDNNPAKGPACFEKCQICCSRSKRTSNTTETKSDNVKSTVIARNIDENIGDKFNNSNKHCISSGNGDGSKDNGNRILVTKRFSRNSIYVDDNKHSVKNNSKMKNGSDNDDDDDDNNDDDDDDDDNNTDNSSHTTKTISGKFFMVNGANISCACPRSPNGFSKYCHLCDGYIDLILVRHTSFINNLKFLLAMSSRNCKISDLSHVEIYRAKKFSFRPNGLQMGASLYNLHSSRVPISSTNDSRHTSVWNCDGEVIHDSEVTIKSHRHLINVYRRGLYNVQDEDVESNSTSSCCC